MAMANFETYVGGRSRLHSWTPRLKLVSLGSLMFAFAAIRQLPLVLPMLCVTAILYLLSELPFSFLLKRLRYPGLFILMVVLVLPFSGETVLWQWGALALRQEGVENMVLVVGRFLSILTLGFVLLGTTPFVTLLRALRSLGLPNLIADMTLLTYRYLFETSEMLSTMQRSMRLRGFGQQQQRWFRLQRQDLQRLAGLLGTLLIRSYERSERVYKAMQLRGYGQLKRPEVKAAVDSSSVLLTGFCIIAALSVVIAEFSLSAPNL